jgi:hypothetical protein
MGASVASKHNPSVTLALASFLRLPIYPLGNYAHLYGEDAGYQRVAGWFLTEMRFDILDIRRGGEGRKKGVDHPNVEYHTVIIIYDPKNPSSLVRSFPSLDETVSYVSLHIDLPL